MSTGDKFWGSLVATIFTLISIAFLISFLSDPEEMSNEQITYMVISIVISVICIKGLLKNNNDES